MRHDNRGRLRRLDLALARHGAPERARKARVESMTDDELTRAVEEAAAAWLASVSLSDDERRALVVRILAVGRRRRCGLPVVPVRMPGDPRLRAEFLALDRARSARLSDEQQAAEDAGRRARVAAAVASDEKLAAALATPPED